MLFKFQLIMQLLKFYGLVIEIEFISGNHREQKFSLVNLSLNFCETTIYDSKVFLENLVAAH